MNGDGLLSRIAEIAHSRIPVYRDSIENVLGVVTCAVVAEVAYCFAISRRD